MANPSTVANIDALLKEDLDPLLRSQIYQDVVTLDTFQKGKGVQKMKTNTFLISLISGDHSGFYMGGDAATADLTTGAPTFAQSTVTAEAGYGTHQITDFAIEAAKGDAGAIKDVVLTFAETLKQTVKRQLNRQFLGLGGTDTNNAALCLVNGAVSGTTVVVDSLYEDPTQFLYEGSVLDIGTEAEHLAGTAESVTVSTVDSSTQFTASASETLVDNDVVKYAGADDDEMNGFMNFASTTNTVQNINRSTAFWAQPYRDTTTEALSEDDMVQAYHRVAKYMTPGYWITTPTLNRKYASLLTSGKRTANYVETLVGGYEGLEFNAGKKRIPVLLEWDVQTTNSFCVAPEAFSIAELSQGWLEGESGAALQKLNLRPGYWATWKFYGNLAIRHFKGGLAQLVNKTA